tara:strand:- start:220 stop:1020 length:801 start_codon:yes stop_codon:yes gene_type:complete
MKKNKKILTMIPPGDGFGVQYSAYMAAIAYCRFHNYTYRHTPMEFVSVSLDDPTDKSSISSLEDFMGFRSDTDDDVNRLVDINRVEKRFFEALHGQDECYFTESVRDELRKMYYTQQKPKDCIYDIAIHIRRGDILDPSLHKTQETKEYASKRIIHINHYKELISCIKKENKNLTICIYSEGSIEDFLELQQDNVHFSLNTDLLVTFHEMVTAKTLIVAPSALSRIAGILSPNEVVVFPAKFEINPCCCGWKTTKEKYGFTLDDKS